MLQPSPEHQRQYVAPINPEIEAKAIKLEQRRMKRHKRLLGAATVALLMGTQVGAYYDDVRSNQELQADSDVSINVLGAPLDKANDDSALIFLDGFGSTNADLLTGYMSRAIQPVVDGQLWSVGYNDAPLSYGDIADQIIKTADEEGVDSISLVGYSAGGSVSMQVEEQISERSSLRIDSIFLISTPDGAKGLRPARQDEINLVENAKWIPGAEYSTPIRFIGEMAFRAGNYTSGDNIFDNIGSFISTARDVHHSLETQKLPGTWLMFDQLLAIENANIKDRIANMDKISDTRVRPTIIYLGTAKPGYDYMVNNVKSSEAIASYAKAAKVPFFVYNVPGAVHTRPDLDNDEYIKTVKNAKEEIQDSINNQISIAYENLLNDRYKHIADAYPSSTPTDLAIDPSPTAEPGHQ